MRRHLRWTRCGRLGHSGRLRRGRAWKRSFGRSAFGYRCPASDIFRTGRGWPTRFTGHRLTWANWSGSRRFRPISARGKEVDARVLECFD